MLTRNPDNWRFWLDESEARELAKLQSQSDQLLRHRMRISKRIDNIRSRGLSRRLRKHERKANGNH